MTKIAIIGATGNVGTKIVAEALHRHHQVTAIARDPSTLATHPRLTPKSLDLNDADALKNAITGHDVVITAVRFDGLAPETLINPLKQSGVARVIVVGGAASLNVAPGKRLLDSPGFPEAYRAEATGGAQFLAALHQMWSVMTWTYVSPSLEFIDGERTGKFRLGLDDLLIDASGRSWISYQDFAIAVLDEVELPVHYDQRFTVGY